MSKGLIDRIMQRVASDLYVQPGETLTIRGGTFGFLTGTQKVIHLFPHIKKRLDLISSCTVVDISGGIRFNTGGYINNVGDSTSWLNQTGITATAFIYGNEVMVDLNTTGTFCQNATSTAVANNSPVVLGGDITLLFN